MSSRWEGGSTRAWRRTRLLVLDRDRWRCQLRLPGCLAVADCVHHTKDRRLHGDDPAWLLASCTPCNLAVGDPTTGDPEFEQPGWLADLLAAPRPADQPE